MAVKGSVINEFITSVKPRLVWDIGCNTGDYSKISLSAGASKVIGFDADQETLELAYSRAINEKMNFLPLYLDLANPSPNQGWAESERVGINKRSSADAIIVLAIIHHLAITKNIPLGGNQ